MPQIRVLHNFTGSKSDGSEPEGSLTLSGSKLYGITSVGGAGGGVIFSMNSDGSGFTLLHSFTGSDGVLPYGSLTVSGSKLYGMTQDGGSANPGGSIFSINTDGSGFTVLHNFTARGGSGDPNDGAFPIGSLTLTGSKLYGMTREGGSSPLDGTIFSINTDGSGFTILHNFGYTLIDGLNDGYLPEGSLILVGSKLYGMTGRGGSDDYGAIFSINIDGTGYTLLHSFTLNTSDGRSPYGSLTLAGSKLYGMTGFGGSGLGGSNESGTIFSMNLDGSGFTLLHSFTGGSDDGAVPMGSLTLSGSKFYGMTEQGGSSGKGTVFSINIDGTGFRLLQSFSGQPNDGDSPGWSDVILSADGATLYGLTALGGSVQ